MEDVRAEVYEAPTIAVIGSVYEVTKGIGVNPTDTLGALGT